MMLQMHKSYKQKYEVVQIFKIAKAWAKVLSQEKNEDVIIRGKICGGCDKKQFSQFLDFIDDEIKEVKGFVCGECGCPLVAKIRSNDKCPLNKW